LFDYFQEIGQGAFGVVWKAYNKRTFEEVDAFEVYSVLDLTVLFPQKNTSKRRSQSNFIWPSHPVLVLSTTLCVNAPA
jgi:hypothetical protein